MTSFGDIASNMNRIFAQMDLLSTLYKLDDRFAKKEVQSKGHSKRLHTLWGIRH